MQTESVSATTPDLRLIPVDAPQPHETHDHQRSEPLLNKIEQAETMTNPPIVTHTADDLYVILDGANRCYTFRRLHIPHILVQVVSYDSGQVQLNNWNHIISEWDTQTLLSLAEDLPGVSVHQGDHQNAIARIYTPEGHHYTLAAPVTSVQERNAALRDFVGLYQQHGRLNRTPLEKPEDVWHLFPGINALVVFPTYTPKDIIAAARHEAYLPPGISRHIVQGRALHVNYPIKALRDTTTPLADKNQQLEKWLQQKYMDRQVRYYAEATYQFSE